MAIMNFIPTVWSETLASALNKQYVAVANCNRDFAGIVLHEARATVHLDAVVGVLVAELTAETL